jgi:hypothetical protein
MLSESLLEILHGLVLRLFAALRVTIDGLWITALPVMLSATKHLIFVSFINHRTVTSTAEAVGHL